MYQKKFRKAATTNISVNNSYIGETIEDKIERIINNGEPIKDGADLIYTERKEGVNPAYDIRHDKWDTAIEAMDKVSQNRLAKREERLKVLKGGKDEQSGQNDTQNNTASKEGTTGGAQP